VLGERLEVVDTATLAACDMHGRFAEHCPGPVVATSDGGLVGGESVDDGLPSGPVIGTGSSHRILRGLRPTTNGLIFRAKNPAQLLKTIFRSQLSLFSLNLDTPDVRSSKPPLPQISIIKI
jgi:hypothetical protein